MFRHAFQLLSDDNPLRRRCFDYLSIAYLERDGNLDGLLQLNAPAVYCQSRSYVQSIEHFEDEEVFDHFYRIHALEQQRRVARPDASFEDLESEIQVHRHALEFFFPAPARFGLILTQLSSLLQMRFRKQRKVEDVNEAVDCSCVAVELVSPEFTFFKVCLFRASKTYYLRYAVLGRREDLENAFLFSKRTMEVVNEQDPDFVSCLASHSAIMVSRYETTGDVNDLDAGIDYSSRAVDMGERSEKLPMLLCNLARQLSLRSARSGRAEDMSEAIAAAQSAVNLLPPKDPQLEAYLTYLSYYEYKQFERLKDRRYLEQALLHIQQADCTREENHKITALEHAGLDAIRASLPVFFDDVITLETQGWDRAIATARGATSSFHVQAVSFQYCLCLLLYKRWKRTQKKEDIDEAISTAHRVIELGEQYTEPSEMARGYLGEMLYLRYKSTGQYEDLEEALEVLLETLRMPAWRPACRIGAAHVAMIILSELADWDGARKLIREVLDLLVIHIGRSLSWQDKQYVLRKFADSAAAYASIALEAGSDALDVIDIWETCRGSILGHLIDSRTDLDDLAEVAPEKAQLFRTLQDDINTGIDLSWNTSTRVKQTTRRIQAEGEIRACLDDIRTLEGFHRFLLGPTFEKLRAAAARGPIIMVNITWIRSDAIIITKNDSVLLPLPELKHQKVKEYIDADLANFTLKDIGKKNKKYRQLQEWLWDNCVKLIFEKLDNLENGSAKFHVWWIPIGIASSLPFHAAGIYTGIHSETALSRAISSYVPTLKILNYGRQKLRYKTPEPTVQRLTIEPKIQKFKPRLGVIMMPSTPGSSDLEGVRSEAEEIQNIVRDTFSIQIPLQPCAKDALTHMAEWEVVHFACHGESTLPDLSSSHLLLQATTPDSVMPEIEIDKLSLRDVAAANLSYGKLAFLSACSTAHSGGLWDEALHLVSGFQVAGYLHAIGNLWLADDQVSVQVVKGFYEHLVAAGELGDGDNVAKALNKVLTVIAKKYAREPLCWAQFVHFGV